MCWMQCSDGYTPESYCTGNTARNVYVRRRYRDTDIIKKMENGDGVKTVSVCRNFIILISADDTETYTNQYYIEYRNWVRWMLDVDCLRVEIMVLICCLSCSCVIYGGALLLLWPVGCCLDLNVRVACCLQETNKRILIVVG